MGENLHAQVYCRLVWYSRLFAFEIALSVCRGRTSEERYKEGFGKSSFMDEAAEQCTNEIFRSLFIRTLSALMPWYFWCRKRWKRFMKRNRFFLFSLHEQWSVHAIWKISDDTLRQKYLRIAWKLLFIVQAKWIRIWYQVCHLAPIGDAYNDLFRVDVLEDCEECVSSIADRHKVLQIDLEDLHHRHLHRPFRILHENLHHRLVSRTLLNPVGVE